MIIPPQSTAINSRFFYFLQRFNNGFPVWRETDARDVEDAVPYGVVIEHGRVTGVGGPPGASAPTGA